MTPCGVRRPGRARATCIRGGGAGVDSGSATRSVTLHDLFAEGARLWRELGPGSVVWLTGDLGAGKTTFVQAVAESAHAIRARSPTFALVHQYESPEGPIAHVDCYRLRH